MAVLYPKHFVLLAIPTPWSTRVVFVWHVNFFNTSRRFIREWIDEYVPTSLFCSYFFHRLRDVSDDGDDVAVKIPLVNLFQGTPIHCYANVPNQDRAKGEVCVLGVGGRLGWGAAWGASAIKPGQKLYSDLALSTKWSRITYSLEYFIREQTSSSTCPHPWVIRCETE